MHQHKKTYLHDLQVKNKFQYMQQDFMEAVDFSNVLLFVKLLP